MHHLMTFSLHLLLLIAPSQIAVKAADIHIIRDDIAEININCADDSCDYFEIDSLAARSCYCGRQCVQLGTCCFDSFYTDIPQPELRPSCRSVYNGKSYFIVDQCPFNNSVWASLCNDEWNVNDDVQKLVPVTSLFTSITYKNYYCFRCHEATDEFRYWGVKLESNFAEHEISENEKRNISLSYDKDTDTWMAIYDEIVGNFPVNLSIHDPEDVGKLAHICEPDVISDCSETWTDEEVRNKCQSYMGIKEIKRNGTTSKYKNIHCSLCNFEKLNDISCWGMLSVVAADIRPFSFALLLDINRSDGDLVGKIQKCSADQLWDPYTKKCRKLSCALPGFKVKNGKCVQE